jgi:hypothetical protein
MNYIFFDYKTLKFIVNKNKLMIELYINPNELAVILYFSPISHIYSSGLDKPTLLPNYSTTITILNLSGLPKIILCVT